MKKTSNKPKFKGLNNKLYKVAKVNYDNNKYKMYPIKPKITGKNIWLLGTGHSLFDYITDMEFKKGNRDNIIFCVDTGIDYLLGMAIKPKYCILIETKRITFKSENFKGITLYAYCGCHPDSVKEWKKKGGKVQYFEFNYEKKYRLNEDLPRLCVAFVSSSVVFGLASIYRAKQLVLLGQEHQFNDPKNIYLHDEVWNGEKWETRKETYKRIKTSLYLIPKKYRKKYKYTFIEWWNFSVHLGRELVNFNTDLEIVDGSGMQVNFDSKEKII